MLLLVRHGETLPNVQGLLLGRTDPPLTARGEAQALALAAALPRPDLVVTSPLRRAVATAGAFAADAEVDDRWIELDYGEFDGRAPSAVPDELWTQWRRDPSFVPPSGESLLTVGERVRAACEALSGPASSSVVVVVSHVSPIKAAIAWALGTGDELAWRMFVEEASASRIDIGTSGPVLRWFNRGLSPTV